MSTTERAAWALCVSADDQVGRRVGMIELDPVIEHPVVDLALALGDDAVSGAAEESDLHIGRQCP